MRCACNWVGLIGGEDRHMTSRLGERVVFLALYFGSFSLLRLGYLDARNLESPRRVLN